MRDFWNQFSLAERFFIELSAVVIKAALLLSLGGCGSVAAGNHLGVAIAAVAIAAADVRATQPELPDSLDEVEEVGAAPSIVFPVVKEVLPEVQFFSTPNCPPCNEAKAYFATSKIPHRMMPRNPDFDKHGYPALAWRVKDRWEYQFGFVNGADFEKRYYGSLKH